MDEQRGREDGIAKAATGVPGLDQIARGGLPAGRTTVICGGPGCGKTVLAMEFLANGAMEFGEPGVFVCFEESRADLAANFRAMGIDLDSLEREGNLAIKHIQINPHEIVETGDFSLDPLLMRLESALSKVDARRVAIDTMDHLIGLFSNDRLLRGELHRLFKWLDGRGVTTVITAESGDRGLTRTGIEEYVSDCVIYLDHRVSDQISKRRFRIVKYRGTSHGLDEYPFTIGPEGIQVLPLASLQLDYKVSNDRVSAGVPDLDAMLGGKGFYKGSGILVSGPAGTGKSTLASSFAASSCRNGRRCIYFAAEESPDQLRRNMASAGTELLPHMESGALTIVSARAGAFGLEEHLISIIETVERFDPDDVVIDPITNYISLGNKLEVKSMLARTLDQLKSRGVTVFFTSLTPGSMTAEETSTDVSSLIDTWIDLKSEMVDNRRESHLSIVKSRGMDHSKQMMELRISGNGIALRGLPPPGTDNHRKKRDGGHE